MLKMNRLHNLLNILEDFSKSMEDCTKDLKEQPFFYRLKPQVRQFLHTAEALKLKSDELSNKIYEFYTEETAKPLNEVKN